MNSWEILKEELTKGTRLDTTQRVMYINQASKLFIKLRAVLSDFDIATKSFNADEEVGDALRRRDFIKNTLEVLWE